MRVSKGSGPSFTWIRAVVGAALISLLLWGITGGFQRLSPKKGVSIDSLNAAGGDSASTSYRQADSAHRADDR